jgi:peptide deformylase
MSVVPIVLWPEPWLNQKSDPVLPEEFGSEALKELEVALVETMLAARGVGLSAPQIGIHKQIIAIPDPVLVDGAMRALVLCNPVLSEVSEAKRSGQEGCLSLPTILLPVERAVRVKLTAKRVDGSDYEVVLDELFAVAAQHECDHLVGRTIADGMGPLRQSMIKEKLKKVMREMERADERKQATLQKLKGDKTNPSEYSL